jgi:L-seryl-tRNA(Ser) seleniumtransferase
MRCDKLTLIAMEATLRTFLHPDSLAETHPTFRMLTASREALREQATALSKRFSDIEGLTAEVADADDAVGAGSLPTVKLPGAAVRLRLRDHEAGTLADRMRRRARPVFTTVHDGWVYVHVRTLQPGDEDDVLEAATAAAAG